VTRSARLAASAIRVRNSITVVGVGKNRVNKGKKLI